MIEVVKYSYLVPKKLFRGSKTAIFGRRTREHGEKIEGASRKFRSHTLIHTLALKNLPPHFVLGALDLIVRIKESNLRFSRFFRRAV
jgi:hypothetical protein